MASTLNFLLLIFTVGTSALISSMLIDSLGWFMAIVSGFISGSLMAVGWWLGNAFRKFTQPDVFLSTGAIDTFNKRIFWAIGPQSTGVGIVAFCLFFLASGASNTGSPKQIENNAKIESTTDQAAISAASTTNSNQSSISKSQQAIDTQQMPNVGPSFDCAKASNNVEHLICENNNLAELDLKLSAAYTAARASASDVEKIKSEQIEWVKSSRKCTDVECIDKAMKDRISQLIGN